MTRSDKLWAMVLVGSMSGMFFAAILGTALDGFAEDMLKASKNCAKAIGRTER